MMNEPVTFTIDTYSFVHNLMAVGFTENQAKVVLDEIKKIQLLNVASKDDVAALREDMSTIKVGMAELKADFSKEVKDLHQSLMRWVIPMILGLYAFLAVMFFKH